jgi:hypothetical protein
MIGVVEKIFPEEVGLLEALKRMEPLTAKPFSELKNPSKTTNPVQPGATIQRLLPATKAIFDKMAPAQTAATPVPENATRSRKLITKVRRRSTI